MSDWRYLPVHRFMLCRAVLDMRKFQPLTTCIHTSYQLPTVMPPTPSDKFYTCHRMTASGHRWTSCGHRRTPKGHQPHQKDTNFGETTHTTTEPDGQSSDSNPMSDDDSGITENAPLEATLGIEGRTRRTNALRSKPFSSLWTPNGHQ